MLPRGFDFAQLIRRFDGPGVRALVLMGSFARGDPGPFSDIDLLRLSETDDPVDADGSHLIEGWLTAVTTIGPAALEASFREPERVVHAIKGYRTGVALIDREGSFAEVQTRSERFVWDEEMQIRANAWASSQMVGWIEEVHKGLEGLRSGGIGRLLNARFGLSWGLSRVMEVQRGVLIGSDNSFYEEVADAMGKESEWVRLRGAAFAIEREGTEAAPPLRQQVVAGLRLYVETARLLEGSLTPEAKRLIEHAVSLIVASFGERAGTDEG
jgi:hypothetical protein